MGGTRIESERMTNKFEIILGKPVEGRIRRTQEEDIHVSMAEIISGCCYCYLNIQGGKKIKVTTESSIYIVLKKV